MKLSSKTFLYSTLIAFIVGAAIFVYMVLLMPSMYMDYKQSENLDYAKGAIRMLKEDGSLRSISSADATTIGVVIPYDRDTITFSGKGYEGELVVEGGSAKELLDKLRSMDGKEDWKDSAKMESEFLPLLAAMKDEFFGSFDGMAKIRLKNSGKNSQFKAERQKIHGLGNGMAVGEFSVVNKATGTHYTTYLGFGKDKEALYLVMSSVITPTATEIRPVIVRSLPMIVLMMILLAFGVSGIYSRKIVRPITKLSADAEQRMGGEMRQFHPIVVEGKDEIADLTQTLNLLYERQAEHFVRLEEENKRKEVFMRASSHQLKTPIAAAALLVDGMIANMGKFANREEYLPKVKEQIQQIQQIVEELVSLNGLAESRALTKVGMGELCEEVLYRNKIGAESKGIALTLDRGEDEVFWQGNREMLEKILDNLIGNGIRHNAAEGEVCVALEKERLLVTNRPAHIEERIFGSIFEPFVTGIGSENGDGERGHGLGLYVARYFAESMGFSLRAENRAEEVCFVLERSGGEQRKEGNYDQIG